MVYVTDEIVRKVAQDSQYPKSIVRDIMSSFSKVCSDAMVYDGKFQFLGLFTVSTKIMPEHTMYDVYRDETLTFPARKILCVKLSKKVREAFKNASSQLTDEEYEEYMRSKQGDTGSPRDSGASAAGDGYADDYYDDYDDSAYDDGGVLPEPDGGYYDGER